MKHVAVVGPLAIFVFSWFVLPEAANIIAGGYEFTDWIGITLSNKTWMFYCCMVAIGGCVGYVGWWLTLGKRKRQDWLRRLFE